jgi:hypothetical protein
VVECNIERIIIFKDDNDLQPSLNSPNTFFPETMVTYEQLTLDFVVFLIGRGTTMVRYHSWFAPPFLTFFGTYVMMVVGNRFDDNIRVKTRNSFDIFFIVITVWNIGIIDFVVSVVDFNDLNVLCFLMPT